MNAATSHQIVSEALDVFGFQPGEQFELAAIRLKKKGDTAIEPLIVTKRFTKATTESSAAFVDRWKSG